jgi:hypothetical protein
VDEKHLSEWEEREIAETVERSREIALRGYVRDYSDLYPDSDIEGTVAYARSLVPLPFLLLLYDNRAPGRLRGRRIRTTARANPTVGVGPRRWPA